MPSCCCSQHKLHFALESQFVCFLFVTIKTARISVAPSSASEDLTLFSAAALILYSGCCRHFIKNTKAQVGKTYMHLFRLLLRWPLLNLAACYCIQEATLNRISVPPRCDFPPLAFMSETFCVVPVLLTLISFKFSNWIHL